MRIVIEIEIDDWSLIQDDGGISRLRYNLTNRLTGEDTDGIYLWPDVNVLTISAPDMAPDPLNPPEGGMPYE